MHSYHNQPRARVPGFTLAELLIALAILGVIATFTIPKILDSGSDNKFNAIAKEAMGTISGAHMQLKLNGQLTPTMTQDNYIQYFNYVKEETVASVDREYTEATSTCSSGTRRCLVLHNGAILHIWQTDYFGSSETTAALPFILDPDGIPNASTTGPGKAVAIWLYYNGSIRTRADLMPNTVYGTGTVRQPDASKNPPWFSWN